MCGRFTLSSKVSDIIASFQVQKTLFEPEPRYNFAPKQFGAIITSQEGERVLDDYQWGLIPQWAKTDKLPYSTIKARVEGLREANTYRGSWKAAKRCIVPADGFYEWDVLNKGTKDEVRLPYFFHFRDERLFGMAGLWEKWHDKQTFTIITALPIETVKSVHDRSPVILQPGDYAAWLDPSTPLDEAYSLLNPWEDHSAMEGFRVNKRVGNVRNDDPGVIDAVDLESEFDE